MNTALYIVWITFPVLMLIYALYLKLESLSKKNEKEYAYDVFKQSIFVFGCVIVAMIVERFILRRIYDAIFPEFIPYPVLQWSLLPFILYVMALLVGGTKEIQIKKAPRQHYKPYKKQ